MSLDGQAAAATARTATSAARTSTSTPPTHGPTRGGSRAGPKRRQSSRRGRGAGAAAPASSARTAWRARSLLRRWQGRRRRSRGGPRRSRGCSAAGGLELAGFAGVFRSPCLPIFGVTSKAEPRQFEKDLLSARPGANRSPRALLRQWACVTSDSRPLIRIDRRLWTPLLCSQSGELAASKALGSSKRERAGLVCEGFHCLWELATP